MNEIIVDIINIVLGVICIIITKEIIPMIKVKIQDTKYEKFLDYVKIVVEAQQQTKTPEENAAKKEEAIKLVTEYLNKNNIALTEQDIDLIIESAVKQLKIKESN